MSDTADSPGQASPQDTIDIRLNGGPEAPSPTLLSQGKRRHQNRCSTSPLRSLGSNHVDLGGMISPASDTVIRSPMLTG